MLGFKSLYSLIPKQSSTAAIIACNVLLELEVMIAVVKDRGVCLPLLTARRRSVLWLSVCHLLNDIF